MRPWLYSSVTGIETRPGMANSEYWVKEFLSQHKLIRADHTGEAITGQFDFSSTSKSSLLMAEFASHSEAFVTTTIPVSVT
jgi:hypothetical protein